MFSHPDEGHGFGRPENSADWCAREEAFLGTYLGGRVEPRWLEDPRFDGCCPCDRRSEVSRYEETRSTVRGMND